MNEMCTIETTPQTFSMELAISKHLKYLHNIIGVLVYSFLYRVPKGL